MASIFVAEAQTQKQTTAMSKGSTTPGRKIAVMRKFR